MNARRSSADVRDPRPVPSRPLEGLPSGTTGTQLPSRPRGAASRTRAREVPRDRPGKPVAEPRLTREQLDGWRTFDADEWQPFRSAWLARGFLWPPQGSALDDPETSLRSRLWEIADARPNDLGRWVREAKGHTPHAVIGEVFARWRGLQDEIGGELDADEQRWQDTKRNDWQTAGDVLRRLQAQPQRTPVDAPADADEVPA